MDKEKKLEKLKTVNIKGKEYVTVNERIRYFNDAYKNGAILTQIMKQENDTVLIKAKIIPDVEQQERYFTGYAQEAKGKGMVNATSYIENCETSAVGRALGFMGIGVETSIASAEEVATAIAQQSKGMRDNNTEIKEPLSKSTNRKAQSELESAQNEKKEPKPTQTPPKEKKPVTEESEDKPADEAMPTADEGTEPKDDQELKDTKAKILEHPIDDIKALLKQFGLKSTEDITDKILASVMLKTLKGYHSE